MMIGSFLLSIRGQTKIILISASNGMNYGMDINSIIARI